MNPAAQKPHAQAPQLRPKPPVRAARPQSRAKPGCIATLFLEITGIGFLLQMKRKLGWPGFLLAFFIVLLFMFIAGAKIERYGHLGEHQYVLSILPLASCFSPILALLMALAFAVGNCLTNATYWLFPEGSWLNLYTLFHKSHPLLTWGAYARMDFITLPIYAILPGLGSRILYSVASRLFQAGRAKILKDGGKANQTQLQQQLNQALSQQSALNQRAQSVGQQFSEAEGRVEQTASRASELGAQESESRSSLNELNTRTRDSNAQASEARLAAEKARGQAAAEERATGDAGRERAEAQKALDKTDADLRLASDDVQNLDARKAAIGTSQAKLDAEMADSQERLGELVSQRDQLREIAKTGKAPDGRPLSPEELARARQEYLKTEEAYASENEKAAGLLAQKNKLEAEQGRVERERERKQTEADGLLKKYREEDERLKRAAEKEALHKKRLDEQRAEAEKQEAASRSAKARAEESQRLAQDEKAKFDNLQREKAQAAAEINQAVDRRNALAAQVNDLNRQIRGSNARVSQLQQALGIPVTPPVSPLAGGAAVLAGASVAGAAAAASPQTPLLVREAGPVSGEHVLASAADAAPHRERRRADDVYERYKREWDRGMYDSMEQQRREREALIAQMQNRYRGSLPSGLTGGEVAGVGEAAAGGLAGLIGAAAGAAAGSIVGGALLHTHMWAEYNPIRQIVHPSHEADVSCYKMDVNYLDKNLIAGATSGAAGGPVSVVTADAGGPGGPAGPAGTVVPASVPPSDVPGSFISGQGPQPPPFNSDDEKAAWEKAQKARQEAGDMKKQWEESEKSADKSGPDYDKAKKQYDDYIKSKEDEASAAQGDYDKFKSDAEKKAADEAEAKAYKDQWIQSRQDDLKAAAEEKAHLEAVKRGADGAGFDTSEHQKRLEDLNQRISDLHGQLGKEGADISYTAADRGVIAPGKEFVEAPEKMKQQEQLLDKLQKMENAALDHGMAEPGLDGKGADVYGKVKNLINDMLDGKTLDPAQIAKIRDHIGHRMDGTSADSSKLPPPESPWYTDIGSMANSAIESGRNLGTCSTSDGKMSWTGLGGRIGIGLLTLGQSEWVFQPLGAAYTMKDAVDKGNDSIASAWWEGTKEAVKQEIGGRIIGGIFKGGVGAFKGMASAEIAGENILEGGAKGAWGSMKQMGSETVKELTDLGSKEAWKKTGSELIFGKAPEPGVGTGTSEEASGPTEKGAAGESPPPQEPPSPKQPLTDGEQAKLDSFKKAAESGDAQQVADLYKNGGMKELTDLQKKGAISGDQMQKVNQVVKQQVNESVEQGTKNAAGEFRDKTGVRVDEVLVGDSGSSAKGSPARAKTDADRTLIPKFNESDLKRYAHNNNMSEAQAHDELCQKFAEKHNACVGDELRSRGFANPNDAVQTASKNVDYKSYDRIGSSSGQNDSYAEGFTNARQSGQGSGQCFKADPEGNLGDPYKVSGQTVVDQNQLNKAKYGAGEVPEEPSSIPPSEIPSVMKQQTDALDPVKGHPDDPVTVAKAVARTEKVANTVGESLKDPNLQKAADEIYKNPGRTDAVLRKYGFCDCHGNPLPGAFCDQGGQAVNGYSQSFSGLTPER